MKITFIATVFNEEENIKKLLDSLLIQTKYPDEIIVIDGNSTDLTFKAINNYQSKFKNKEIKFSAEIKTGNRSVGRNEAIKKSIGDIIICSDAGCILDKDWVKNITKTFEEKAVEVVAGYYEGLPENIFQKCLIPYVLVMPDKINSDNFLPATRSIAFSKNIWEKVGGFPEVYSHNEDYVFANKLKKINAKIVFQKDALVYWLPRKNLKESFVMFFRFALGDAEAKIFRPKVALIFARYIFGFLLLIYFLITKSFFILYSLYLILFIYALWAIGKNYKYVSDLRAIFILPILQLTSDIAVIAGTIFGSIKIWDTKKM